MFDQRIWPANGLLDRLGKNNPFYLISAAFMLGGCVAVENSSSWVSIPLRQLLGLIATLNIYEAALIALSLYLLRHKHLVRDGIMLLVLEAFFLIDITFLNAELATAKLSIGLPLEALLFVLALVKLGLILFLLGIRPRDGRFAAIALQLLVLFVLPIVLRWRLDNGLSTQLPRLFYGIWWLLGMLIPLSIAIVQWLPGRQTVEHPRAVTFLLALPWLSLLLHVGIMHYVYEIDFYGCMAAPLLLGLALLLKRAQPTLFVSRKDMTILQALLPAMAVVVSLHYPGWLNFSIGFGHAGRLALSPLRLAVAGAYLTYIYCFAWDFARYFLATGAAAVLMLTFGPPVQQVGTAINTSWDRSLHLAWRLVPETTAQWGALAIVLAFAFLALGALVSLRPRQQPQPPEIPPQEFIAPP